MFEIFRVPIKFIKLAPKDSLIIFIGSLISGFFQSLTAFSFVPLSDILGISSGNENSIINLIKSIYLFLGLQYNLLTVLISLVFFISIISIINFSTKAYSAKISARLIKNLRLKVIESIVSAKWSYFTSKKSGEFIFSIIGESGKCASGYTDSIAFFSSSIQAIIMIASAFLIDSSIAIFSIAAGLFLLIIFKRWVKKAGEVGKENQILMKTITEIISNGIIGIKPLKSMNRDHLLAPQVIRETKKLETNQFKLFLVSAIPEVFREPLIMFFIVLGIYFVSTYSLIPFTNLIPLVLLFQRTSTQIGVTQGTFQSIKKMEPFLVSLEKNIASASLSKEKNSGQKNFSFRKKIVFQNVNFSYKDKIIFKDLNFEIKKNEFIAIVGSSGSGKSTFLDMLCRLTYPNEGNIFIDDVNYNELDINYLRSNIGYIPQELYLFNDTLFNNISLGDPDINKVEVSWSLEMAGADEFIYELEDGLDTNVGEAGMKLSGGQRQRLSIARALVKKPQILLLDEATSALDSNTEEKILSTFKNLSKSGITIIAVSHQPAILKYSDINYELKNHTLLENF